MNILELFDKRVILLFYRGFLMNILELFDKRVTKYNFFYMLVCLMFMSGMLLAGIILVFSTDNYALGTLFIFIGLSAIPAIFDCI